MLARLQFQLQQKIQYSWRHARYLSLSPGTIDKNVKPDVSVADINKNVKIFQHSTPSPSPRPLVLLFGWLFAKPHHLKKFVDIYIQQGFDVISIQVFLKQVLRPKTASGLVRSVLDLCELDGRKTQNILVHAMSAGGFMYGEVLSSFEENPTKYANVSGRLFGQIFDSVFHVDRIPGALGRALTSNKSIGSMIELPIKSYWAMFPMAVGPYRRVNDPFRTNKLRLPSVFLFSFGDPYFDQKHYEDVAAKWRASDVHVAFQIWNDVPHVGIYKKHQEEYEQIILDFIKMIGISQ